MFFAFFGSNYSDILKVGINIEGIGENDGSAVFYLGKCNIFGLPLIILGASVIGIIALIRTKKLPPIAKIVLVILALLILWYVEFYL